MKKYNHKKIQIISSLILSFISIFCIAQTPTPKFHDTKGNIDVTGAGQLQYTLPIDLPPGVKNIAPGISLVYVSGATNGLAGYGWNITGLSSISRVGKNLEKDGITKGVQLDYVDYYSFNGHRLILKSGEYGKDGAEYVTEKYSNIKIKSVGNITGQNWQGPEYWEVTSPDGSIAWYGATAPGNSQARTPIDYNIVKTKDTDGNYVTYNYTLADNVSLISSIEWGGNETTGTNALNKINFNFIARPYAETAYIKGNLFSQSKVLQSIVVSSNSKQYKKYNIAYKYLTDNPYKYLEKITILNGNNEEANPVTFTYEEPYFKNGKWSSTYTIRPNANDITGDFNGDGYLDVLRYHSQTSDKIPQIGLYLYSNYLKNPWQYDVAPVVFVGNMVTSVTNAAVVNLRKGSLIRNRQGFVLKKEVFNSSTSKTDLILSFYGLSETNQLVLDYTKTIPGGDYDFSTGTISNGVRTTVTAMRSVDFNGDGLNELVISLSDRECHPVSIDPEFKLPPDCTSTMRYFVVDPDESIQGNAWYYPLELYPDYDKLSQDVLKQYWSGDFNGDGVFDLMKLSQDLKPVLITFQKNTLGQYESSIAPFNPANDETIKGYWQNTVVGDYNGDGLSDLMMPGTATSAIWYLYTSKGNGFKEETKVFYRPEPTRRITTDPQTKNIFVANPRTFVGYDVNNDGKTELVMLEGGRGYVYVTQDGAQPGYKYTRNYTAKAYILSTTAGELPPMMNAYCVCDEVVYLNGEYNTANELAPNRRDVVGLSVDQWTGGMLKSVRMVSMNGENYGFANEQEVASSYYLDLARETRIKTIQQGGITTEITYKLLENDQILYKPFKTENYPFVEIDQSYGMHVVSEMTQTPLRPDQYLSDPEKVKLRRLFRYRGLTANILGKGMVGFKKMARTSWYNSRLASTVIWSGIEIDTENEGIPLKEWSLKYTSSDTEVFPDDLSENNTQLLSLKSTIYQTIKLLNGQQVTSVTDADKAKVVTVILPARIRVKDFLTGTVKEDNIIYEQYYLPLKIVSKINDTYGVTTSVFEYQHNPSGTAAGYYIGRLKSKTETQQAYGDSQSGKEEFTYENNRIKTLKKWNRNNTGNILETYSYDGFGNITGKILSNSVDSQERTSKSQYDPTGRFIIKKTDHLGLETEFLYNNWGQVTSQTDPLGNILTSTYDNWGKLVFTENSLQGKTSYIYERDTNDNVTVTRNDPDGNISKTLTNKLGQVYKATTKAFGDGQYVSKETQYDVLGRKIKESEPYFDGESASQWNTISYDESVYPANITATAFMGKQTLTSVSGLTTTVKEMGTADYGRTTSKTSDALGNVISSTDKGGTIKLSYNAAGEQVKAQYAENAVTTTYDVWGRKSEFNDPSNGLYKYEYDGFGQPKKTISPKGTKEYTYNNLGQLVSQKELSTNDGGAATNKDIIFTYNTKGMLTKKSGTANSKAFSTEFGYDPQGRITSAIENHNGRSFANKGITYDDKGREISYIKQLSSSGMLTEVQIENVYNEWNGELYQIKDKQSEKVLWQLLETNAKGQVLESRLGAANIINTYNTATGMLSEIKHLSPAQTVLNIQYGFNAIRNELKSRKTLGDFNIIESFDYDNNNRLLKWTNPATGQLSDNTYDEKGRIRQNDQVGEIKFDNSSKIYQPTGMSLNNNGVQNYNGDLIQTVIYNENNDPVQINGEKSRINFEYGLGSMRQRVDISSLTQGTNEPAWNDTFTKFYSEDGSFEVVKNLHTAQEKHILYIGGNPYESNIVYLKNFEESSGSYKFLHKDYIGSILAVSDQAGNKVEQRHYDAWGNLTHLKIGTSPVTTDKLLIAGTSLVIDRGYTGHEHFMGVGIIHMNGRLYDPLLRRFLNADENIQDPANTQNYNKYGYVMNNPLMYNDPSGEFLQWIIGAFVGGYLNGVAANNGNWNPGKWDWQKSWSAVLGGAIGGMAISGTLGTITSNPGAIKFVLPSIVSGGLNSAFSGGNFLGGAVGGLSYTSNLSGNKITSTDGVNSGYKHYMISNDYDDENFGLSGGGTDPLSTVLSLLGISPSAPASMYSFSVMASVLVPRDAWIAVANQHTMKEWSKEYISFKTDKDGLFIDPADPNIKIRGITNPFTGKIILAPGLLNGKRTNYGLGSVIVHEINHFSNWKNGILQGNHPLIQDLNEVSAYKFEEEWTGTPNPVIYDYFKSIGNYMLNIINIPK
ncbi:type IV secretion protein Rhs [Chryseobacterium panacisoli]|uniref:Type IV secretion protein Rhs n=1 Tax=Chryseobacterium panacisoli TaxID=1807141 RepID=A0A5D8ZN20_9FLAO|nr:RHS repeat-associated core domain-containing protein [Chryseobacterium panacisoli]TZF94194.1 type IV secretion protein Rhs [Chryseobacterium panacisoli]